MLLQRDTPKGLDNFKLQIDIFALETKHKQQKKGKKTFTYKAHA